MFLTESWFWRGTQSAIFYYASCAPWTEYKHKKKRRQEATHSQKQKSIAVIDIQPGVIQQPAPFQTNEHWAQEIVQGPGPPKGWKRDSIYYKYAQRFPSNNDAWSKSRPRGATATSTESPGRSDYTAATGSSTTAATLTQSLEVVGKDDSDIPNLGSYSLERLASRLSNSRHSDSPVQAAPGLPVQAVDIHHKQAGHAQNQSVDLHAQGTRAHSNSVSRKSSFESSIVENSHADQPRPSMEKRLSTAMDGFKDTMRAALHPEHWNWIRYERDDEILSNINERMKGMWGSMKEHMIVPTEEQVIKGLSTDAKDSLAETQVKKWQRGMHPGVNDLSPPIVSQLPYSKEEAQWMLLPPPSADVMMGRARPDLFDDIKRKPLCVMGRSRSPVSTNSAIDFIDVDLGNGLDSSTDSSEEEWDPGRSHVQKPQRAYLMKRRASYV